MNGLKKGLRGGFAFVKLAIARLASLYHVHKNYRDCIDTALSKEVMKTGA